MAFLVGAATGIGLYAAAMQGLDRQAAQKRNNSAKKTVDEDKVRQDMPIIQLKLPESQAPLQGMPDAAHHNAPPEKPNEAAHMHNIAPASGRPAGRAFKLASHIQQKLPDKSAPAAKPEAPQIRDPSDIARPPPRPRRPGKKAETRILQRLVITSEGGQFAKPEPDDTRVHFVGFFPFSKKPLQHKLGDEFIGRPIKSDVLKQVRNSLKRYARDAGYPFARITIPRQDVTNGTVRIVMRQSRLAAIRVEGNTHYTDQRIIDKITLRPGDIINTNRLDEAIQDLNKNPALSVRAVFSEGGEPGTSLLTLKVRDNPRISTFLAFNNTGTPSTQEQQASLGFTDYDFLGMKTRLDYTHSRSVGNNNLRSHYVALTRRFDSGAELSLDFAYSRTEASILGGALESRGWSRQVTTDYSHPLPDADLSGFKALALRDQSLTAGLEYKNTQGNVLFTLFGAPVQTGSGSDTEVYNLKLAYKGLITDPYDGKTRLEAKAYASPGDLSEINDDQAFDQARIGADAQYAYARLEAERRAPVDLPAFKRDARLLMAFRGQYSPERLIGTERFIAGGASRPRGYHASTFSGDYGYVGTLALGLPPYRFRFGELGENRVQLSAFTDFGMVGNVNNRPGEPATEGFGSVGVALDYAIGDTANLKASLAQDIAGVEAEREQTALLRLQTSLDPLYN